MNKAEIENKQKEILSILQNMNTASAKCILKELIDGLDQKSKVTLT